MLRQNQPHISAVCKDGTSWVLPTEAYANFSTAYMAGRAFWTGVDLWGAGVIIKLGDITGIVQHTTQSIALRNTEEAFAHERELFSSDEP